ncbi:alginate lyase family protein [Hydrogenimonas sp. SS33]|uniref:heparinase II/III family protein n=1 Tax=Hydrogenimonas leucolamina TaxID=2954236 RepID=UPI00336C10DC
MKRLEKMLLLINTLRYLKAKQIYYRAYYTLRKKICKMAGVIPSLAVKAEGKPPNLTEGISPPASFRNGTFTFLNLSRNFENGIDWNFPDYGKLWTYNLTYFDFLMQEGLDRESGLALMDDFINKMPKIRDGLEPFPISLRGINWIKFISRHGIRSEKIDASLRAQYAILEKNLEYHLLGNHLLENGFSLLFGGCYFDDKTLLRKANKILSEQLEEQILEDGAHFELSPMYHQIMLYRILDCINLLTHNDCDRENLLPLLRNKASLMLGWLQNITFSDGSVPLMNDSAEGIAPESEALFAYARRLGVQPRCLPLGDSGYRTLKNRRYEAVVDVGRIGPDYIPGHAHADTFSFELHAGGKPLVVDTGTSTYETGGRRTLERGTAAHNTVEVNRCDQSEVWGGFRVARRAGVHGLKEENGCIEAWHDGYLKKFGARHKRAFIGQKERFTVVDTVEGPSGLRCVARLHLHPDTAVHLEGGTVMCGESVIRFKGGSPTLASYEYAPAFNSRREGIVIEVPFEKYLKTEIIP